MATPVKIRNLVAPAGGLLVSSGPTRATVISIMNTTGAAAFVQFFNAIAGVTLGTTTPDFEVQVAAGGTVLVNLPPDGLLFATGLIAASTTTEGGNVASAAGVMVFLGI